MRFKILDYIRLNHPHPRAYKYVGNGEVITEEQMEEIIRRAKEIVRPRIEQERRDEFRKPKNVIVVTT